MLKGWDDDMSENKAPSFEQLTEENAVLRQELLSSKLDFFMLKSETLEKELEAAKAALAESQKKCKVLNSSLRESTAQLQKVSHDLHMVTSSRAWKMTAPIRKCGTAVRKITPLRRVLKGTKILLTRGPRGLKLWYKQHVDEKRTAEGYAISKKRRQAECKTVFEKDITISVLVPLYNTPEKYLREMIESVQNQTYRNWQLCLADGSDAEHGDVETIVKSYVAKDERIVYQKLDENRGISENTNACIEMATGTYIALFDHDDLLHPSALHRVMKVICEKNADFIYTDEATFINDDPAQIINAHFKADFAIDTLRSYNYICHLSVFTRELLDKVGYFRKECDGSQDYDLILRLTEQANTIVHIPELLYFWRGHANSTAQDIQSKPYIVDAAHKALADHLDRCGLKGSVGDSSIPSTYRIRYDIEGNPLVSIIIANKDEIKTLDTCIQSILTLSTYTNYEIIIVENNSTSPLTFEYYEQLQQEFPQVRVITWKDKFNYSAINNFGFKEAKGDYVILLNNDVEIITKNWIEEMLMFAQRGDVGAVGAMLYYPDDTIQHAGVIIGIGGVAGHSHKCYERNSYGYMSRATIAQNLSAVTFACVMMRSEVFAAVNGLDEAFEVAFNDVDMCMRIRKAGFLIVFTPYAELYHYESKSRGMEDTPEKMKRFEGEVHRFRDRWMAELDAGDPYYNPNLTLEREDFTLKRPL